MVLIPPGNARLTPDRINAISFRLSRRGRRGLDEDDVQDFCDRVRHELERLLKERTALCAEVSRLRRRLRGRPEPGDAAMMPLGAPVGQGSEPAPFPGDPNVQATRILLKAQQTADRYVADAHAYSEEIAEEACRRRDQILAEARARAKIMLEEAHYAAARAVSARAPAQDRFPF